MRQYYLFATLLILASCLVANAYEFSSIESQNFMINVDQTSNSTNLQIAIDDIPIENQGDYQKFSLSGVGTTGEVGLPELPVMTKLVAIPNHGGVDLVINSVQQEIVQNMNIMPVQPDVEDMEAQRGGVVVDSDFYTLNQKYPSEIATISDPMVFRDFRVVQLNIYPYQFNPAKKELTQTTALDIEIIPNNESSVNIKQRQDDTIARSFDKIYRKMIVNYDEVRGDRVITDGGMLIIAHDSFMDAMAPLANWKNQKGIPTELIPLSQIGSNPSELQIKGFLYGYYHTSEIPLEYVLLVGDVTMPNNQTFTCFRVENSNETDHPFTLLDGTNDYLPEVHIGRFAIDEPNEALIVTSKIINYESNPTGDNPDWFKSALMVGARYHYGVPITSPREVKRWVYQEFVDFGYTQVDSVYYPEVDDGGEIISQYVNAGVSIVNYRGWAGPPGWINPIYSYDDVFNLSNENMLPLVTSIVCGTGKFDSSTDPCFGEAWLRAGSLAQPTGGIAFYGSSETVTHTSWNNELDGGIYISLLHDGMNILGEILDGAEVALMKFKPGKAANECEGEDCVNFYFEVYNLLGDPSMLLWTDTPQEISVEHETTLPIGQNYFDVTVTAEGSGINDAMVCVMKGDEVHSYGRTDANGYIALPIEEEITAGNMSLTITKANHEPYTTTISVSQENYIGYTSHSFADDEVIEAGETVNLNVVLKNFGSENASGVTGTLSCDNPFIQITNSQISYGNINAGQTATPSGDFQFEVAANIPHEYPIRLVLTAEDDGDNESVSQIFLVATAAQIGYNNDFAYSGDGVWNAGETVDLTLTLENHGGLTATNVTGELSTTFSGVTVTDANGSFGNIVIDGSGNNSGNTFSLSAEPNVYEGMSIPFLLEVSDENGYADNVLFRLPIGSPDPTNPLGPDMYGYYMFDNTDTDYEEAPTYDWIEIDPNYGGTGTGLNLDDDVPLYYDLPFTFTYYGEDYNRISISPNGWITVGEVDWHYFLQENAYNYYIGSQMNPKGLIAAYWDNLNFPVADGDIYVQHDTNDHKFIIQWSRVGNKVDDYTPAEYYVTFQMILFDPDYHETVTGDAPILFQYLSIPQADHCTIGIEKPDHNDGLQYVYQNFWADSATPIADNMAIYITTNTPYVIDIDDENGISVPAKAVLGQNYPNPFNPHTAIQYGLNEAGHVKLSIYDMSGKLIKVLMDEEQVAGYHTVKWNGTDEADREVGSGIYLYKMETKTSTQTKRMVLVR